MSNNKIMQFSYLRKLNRPARKRRYFTLESAITAKVRDAPRKLHHGILFGRWVAGGWQVYLAGDSFLSFVR